MPAGRKPSGPDGEARTQVARLRLTAGELDALRGAAARRGLTISDLIREWLRKATKGEKPAKP